MYKEYYGLSADPFRMTTDHSNLYFHPSFTKARSYVQYALHNSEGVVLMTGDPGTGKSSLINSVIESSTDLNVSSAIIECTDYTGAQLLGYYARILGAEEIKPDVTAAIFSISDNLKRLHDLGKRAVLVLDEAQQLTVDALQKLTLLANLQSKGESLVQIFLVGQPSLRETLLHPELEQLHQRLVATCHVERLDVSETKEYILQNLRSANWNNNPAIASNVYTAVHRSSLGIRRWVNLICSRLMLHAIANDCEELELHDLCEVLSDLIREGLLPQQIRETNLKAA